MVIVLWFFLNYKWRGYIKWLILLNLWHSAVIFCCFFIYGLNFLLELDVWNTWSTWDIDITFNQSDCLIIFFQWLMHTNWMVFTLELQCYLSFCCKQFPLIQFGLSVMLLYSFCDMFTWKFTFVCPRNMHDFSRACPYP